MVKKSSGVSFFTKLAFLVDLTSCHVQKCNQIITICSIKFWPFTIFFRFCTTFAHANFVDLDTQVEQYLGENISMP